jgi:hypothetical protein
MSELVSEVLLRASKVLIALVLGALLYLVLTGPVGASGSVELAVLSFLAGGLTVLLFESSPL